MEVYHLSETTYGLSWRQITLVAMGQKVTKKHCKKIFLEIKNKRKLYIVRTAFIVVLLRNPVIKVIQRKVYNIYKQ